MDGQKDKYSTTAGARYLLTHPAAAASRVSPVDLTLVHILADRARTHPSKTIYSFVADDNSVHTISWKMLLVVVQRVAVEILNLADRGDRVVLLYPPGLDYIVGFLGCLVAGVIAVPAYSSRNKRNAQRVISILNDCAPSLILVERGSSKQLESMINGVRWLETSVDDLLHQGSVDAELPPPQFHDVAFLQYTSGSTGEPKGVMVTHQNLVSNAARVHSTLEFSESSVFVTWLPPYHDMGLIAGLLQAMYSGSSSVIFAPTSFLQQPIKWLRAISEFRATHSGAPNFAYDLCATRITEKQKANIDLSSWQVAFCGAEPIRADTLDRFYHAFKDCGFQTESFLPCYGLAEATLLVSTAQKGRGATTIFCPEQPNKRLIGVGFAAGQHVAIVDPDSQGQLSDSHVGEIWVSGENVALGYWKKNEATQKIFQASIKGDIESRQFLRTGDLGFIQNGELYITGRLKDLIIVNGRNIYPQDVESVSFRSDCRLRVDGAAAFSVDTDDVTQLAIVQELDFRQSPDESIFSRIAKAVSDELGTPPDIIVLVKAGVISRTSSGKIRRKQCRADFENGTLPILARWDRKKIASVADAAKLRRQPAPIDEQKTLAAATDIEERIWGYLAIRNNLNANSLDRELPFAYYGLTSIDAVELAGELTTWLGRQISPTLFWEYPTLAQLSEYLAMKSSSLTNAEPHRERLPATAEPIAIVGLGCRLPGADTPEAFWQLLSQGIDTIRLPPDSRYAAQSFTNRHPHLQGISWAGFLDQVDKFDARFFGISPHEAVHIDPQQRLVMEVAWEALENAGIAVANLANTDTGVFIGVATHDYEQIQNRTPGGLNLYAATGSAASIAANRLSYAWDLRGPSIAVDTACSSSLVAVHLACQSLRSDESCLAIAGGVNVILSTDSSLPFAQAGMLAADGRCKTFDARADGYVRGEGCGVVVLKRFSDAQRDGDIIHAVILGSATSQDGRSNGLIAPNGNAQATVIRRALADANITAQQISYVETHGTGTALGDPIELNALKTVLLPDRARDQLCALGSVKTNIGHLEAAAGMAGLLKVILALQHRAIPPNLHYQTPNPHGKIDGTPFTIPTQLQRWDCKEKARYAGVSSFGFGGSLAHIVLTEAPAAPQSDSASPYHLLTFSAKTEAALERMTDSLASTLQSNADLPLADVCYTHQVGRNAFVARRMLVCRDRDEAIAALRQRDPAMLFTTKANGRIPSIVFMCSDGANQKLGSTEELYRCLPAFRAAVDSCAKILKKYLGQDLREILYASDAAASVVQRKFADTEFLYAVQFVTEYALAKLWMQWGIRPSAISGHGVGEYLAACLAGVFSVEEVLPIVVARSRLLQQLTRCPQQGMTLGEQQSQLLDVFADLLADADKKAPTIPLVSGATGAMVTEAQAVDAAYWVRLLREPPRFSDALSTLRREGKCRFLKLGLDSVFNGFNDEEVSSTLNATQKSSELFAVLDILGRLWVDGHVINWSNVYAGQRRHRLCLPSHPFERERYWIDQVVPQATHFKQSESPQSLVKEAVKKVGINMEITAVSPVTKPSNSFYERIRTSLQKILAQLMHTAPERIDPDAPLLELGADSLMLAQAVRKIEQTFGMTITIRQIFEDFTTISQMALHLSNKLPANWQGEVEMQPAASSVSSVQTSPILPEQRSLCPSSASFQTLAVPKAEDVNSTLSAVERIMAQQLAAFTQLSAQQLAIFKGISTSSVEVPSAALVSAPKDVAVKPIAVSSNEAVSKPYVPYQPVQRETQDDSLRTLTPKQRSYLNDFVHRYTERTRSSKALTQRYRSTLSDNRAMAGFRFSVKEMLYPIISKRSEGARIWDVDGNEYIDLTMGFGVNLFGHRPAFIEQALERQLKCGMELGPQTQLAGEVAELVCGITGLERMTFCNSGTEGVMLAMRLARTVTKRDKIAIFAGSYHGWSDDTLATPGANPELHGAAMAPGVYVEHTLVLEYGSPRSLEIIRAHAHELAAVLVEPVQSRRPDFQPHEFLQSLRTLTREQDIALIFDEIITGFRLHQGGAQAWYGIKADMAVYGKVVGGGMPIGIVAGAAQYLDAVDGGQWQYGDRSYPQVTTTFFAGTFCKHPLSLAATRATLQKLLAEGPALHEQLSERTSALVARLNALFSQTNLSVKAVHCGSLFRLNSTQNVDLLFYHAAVHGLYIWEGRNMFISTAHTQADLDRIVDVFEASIRDLREGGFFSNAPSTQTQFGTPVCDSNDAEKLADVTDGDVASAPCVVPMTRGEQNTGGLPPGFWDRYKNGASSSVDRENVLDLPRLQVNTKPMRFSLSFFGNYESGYDESKYQLLVDSARFADSHGFTALWLPERHFHAFGGLSPNPAVLAAALARETHHIQLRAGSIVLPLHHPISVAEEWAMVDNLSNGRVGIAFASGWHPNDFVLAPETFGNHRELMFQEIEQVQTLWRGQTLPVRDGARREIEISLFPMPKQADLPTWITVVNNPETYERAGAIGAGILTNLMGQTVEDLANNIARYHEALKRNGYDASNAHITVLLHTFVGDDADQAREQAKQPFISYLRSSLGLFKTMTKSLGLQVDVDTLSKEDLDYLLGVAYDRYVNKSALIGNADSCMQIVSQLHDIGVDEIGCFVDFGLAPEEVLAHLPNLDCLLKRVECTTSDETGVAKQPDALQLSPAVLSDDEPAYPLTSLQQGIWFECQLNKEATLRYNATTVLSLRGFVRHEVLARATQEVIARHPALRSVIDVGGSCQRVLAASSVPLPITDLTGYPVPSVAADEWLANEACMPFDLARGGLVRLHLLRLDTEQHLLVVSIHHIVTDGVSQGLLLQEIAASYRALCQGRSLDLAPALPFSMYVSQEQTYLASEQFHQDECYWHEQYVHEQSKVLALPTDHPYGPQTTGRAAQQSITIEGSLKSELHRLGVANGCTLFMTLLSAFTTLLHRLTHQDDLVIGVPMVAGRPANDLGNLVGCTVNVVPIRCRPRREQSFVDYLAEIRSSLLKGASHVEYPFGLLVRKLNLKREPNRRPLTSVLFNMDGLMEPLDFGDLQSELVPSPLRGMQEDLLIDITQSSDRMAVKFTYKQDLFDEATIARWMNHFVTLLKGIVAHPDACLGNLPLLDATEKHRLLVEWNATDVSLPEVQSLHELFEAQAATTPDATAVLFEDQSLTYGELNARANQLAHYLHQCGVGPEILVGIHLNRSLNMIIGLLAILKAGGAYVPLEPGYPHDRLAGILSDLAGTVSPLVRLTETAFGDGLPKMSHTTICLDVDAHLWHLSSTENLQAGTLPHHPAYVIYTSGSTGQPKGVINTHRGIVNRLQWMQDTYLLTATDRVLQKTPLSFDVSVWELFWPLLAGARLILARPEGHKDGSYLVDIIAEQGVTVAHFVPSMLNLWLESDGVEQCDSLKHVFCSGEALTHGTQQHFFQRLNSALYNLYGPTEAAVDVTHWACQREHISRAIPIGRPIANTQIYILDDGLNPVPIGVQGELFIAGVGLARGYLNRPNLTEERFLPNPFDNSSGARMYRTGDLARYLPDGNIEYLGRQDYQVKIRGFRIELGEIEAALTTLANVREAVVLARDEIAGQRSLVAYVVTQRNTSTGPLLKESLSRLLPDYMIPPHFVFLNSLPLTPNGKVDRQALPTPDLTRLSGQTYIKPRTSLEQALAGVWAEVLNLKVVGSNDNFFDLGGNSLLAIQLQSQLKKILGREIAVMELFHYPTVASLAHHLSQLQGQETTYGAIDERVQKARAARGKRKHSNQIAA